MNNLTFTIRRALPTDAANLAAFGARLYQAAFSEGNTPENMTAYLAKTYGIPQQTAELSDEGMLTLLAENIADHGYLIGYAQVRRNLSWPGCVTSPAPLELYRFYVDYPYHGSGAAQRLMQEAFTAAGELGGRSLWLSVWEQNPRAVAFYAKCGFIDVGTADFWMGTEQQTDRVMVADLTPYR